MPCELCGEPVRLWGSWPQYPDGTVIRTNSDKQYVVHLAERRLMLDILEATKGG